MQKIILTILLYYYLLFLPPIQSLIPLFFPLPNSSIFLPLLVQDYLYLLHLYIYLPFHFSPQSSLKFLYLFQELLFHLFPLTILQNTFHFLNNYLTLQQYLFLIFYLIPLPILINKNFNFLLLTLFTIIPNFYFLNLIFSRALLLY